MNEVYEALLDEPIHLGQIRVTRGWFKPTINYDMVLTGATANTMYRIVSIIKRLKIGSEQANEELRMYEMITGNIKVMAQIIAIALHNQKSSPPEFLAESIMELKVTRIKEIMEHVYRRLGIEPFFECMALIRNLNVHKSDTPETILPGH